MRTFIAFTKWLGVRLSPSQRMIGKVAFDGLEPCHLVGEERELARQIFGDVETIPPAARAVFVAVCGARGGKSYVLIALRLLHLAIEVPLTSLAPGEVASAVIVGPDLKLARQALRFARGAVEGKAELRARLSDDTADGFTIQREGGRAVSVECLAAARGGSATRGRSLVGAALDECAFFRDENAVVNDVDVFKAVAPRVMPGGQVVLASTPWAEDGLLYDLFSKNHGDPTTAIAAHAPTVLLRSDDPHTLRMVARERLRDPDNAEREFDARFMTSGSALFFDEASIKIATSLPPPEGALIGVGAGMDPGFRRDASALALARKVGNPYSNVGVIDLFYAEDIKPERGRPLVPSEVCSRFADVLDEHSANTVACDLHYIESVREHMSVRNVSLVEAPAGNQGKMSVYLRFRELMRSGLLRILDAPRLIAQLRKIQSKPLPGGGLAIFSPRNAGGHGDLVSAAVLAVHQAAETFIGSRTATAGTRRGREPAPRDFDPEDYMARRAEERRRVLSGSARKQPKRRWAS